MARNEIPEVVMEADDKLPHFEDGRIDYTSAEKAPVVIFFLKHENEILILKRSDRVGTHRQRWGLVAGYLDELKPVMKKGLEELREETGIGKDQIDSIERKGKYEWRSEREDKEYQIFLFLAKLEEKPKVELNWENEEYKWIGIDEAEQYLSTNAVKELEIVLSS